MVARYNIRVFCVKYFTLTSITGFVDKRTIVPQIRPEILPLIGSAIILGRDIQLLDNIGQGKYKRMIVGNKHVVCITYLVCSCHAMHAFWKHKLVRYTLFTHI